MISKLELLYGLAAHISNEASAIKEEIAWHETEIFSAVKNLEIALASLHCMPEGYKLGDAPIIYGVTCCNSEGFDDATESSTGLYSSSARAKENAWLMYEVMWDDYEDEVDGDVSVRLTKEDFLKELEEGGYVCIQLYDSHIQIEYFEQTLDELWFDCPVITEEEFERTLAKCRAMYRSGDGTGSL